MISIQCFTLVIECVLSWNKGNKVEIAEQQLEDVQSKLTKRYYHLVQDAPFATTVEPLSARKLVFHQIQVLYFK